MFLKMQCGRQLLIKTGWRMRHEATAIFTLADCSKASIPLELKKNMKYKQDKAKEEVSS
jgi:hypothetical protein